MYLSDIHGPVHTNEEVSSVYACDEYVPMYRGISHLIGRKTPIHAQTDLH